MPIDVRVDQSLPAFTRGSLDNDSGNGVPAVGNAAGQINLYLFWETKDIVDEPGRWEMTVGLIDAAPKDVSTADITPRRVQRLTADPGTRLKWTNISLQGKKTIQSGEAIADKWGLITMQDVLVGKGKNRIILSK